MADLFNKFFGSGSTPSHAPATDADFADFAEAPDPSPVSIASDPSIPSAPFATGTAKPFTKWYRVWERTQASDFYLEMMIAPFILLILLFHFYGIRVNRRKAKSWATAHAPVMQQEFAVIGFGDTRKTPNIDEAASQGLAGMAFDMVVPEQLLKEKAANEFITYATGRQNVAFMDVKLTFVKRYNPILRYGEIALGFFFESLPASEERMEVSIYNFDGRESSLVPSAESVKKSGNSTYDGFVFAVVHKNLMKRLRDDRYDLSLTTTKDNAKLPTWATVMSESAEITDTLLTADLIKAIETAGEENFEAIIITDMPIDQPKKLDELVPKKRTTLSLRIPSNDKYSAHLPLFQSAIRIVDSLVSGGRFRAEALRRVKQTREDEMKKIRKIDDSEKAEERKLKADKEKKEKRDASLKNLSAEDQRKFLEKEREKSQRKGQKKMTMKA
ncbi:DUF1682-domain-containing protein [Pseudovirgaria hyperparasitica]|uniref:DUF1682-domain-containing protein n=1 Tax=Pseudovirgaria hyperparasitica TaxID=470096 RepID=A0A6A6WA75_9PEZI|nr:DUF1682-domain-containing protein [Pseudovirgaria hyperparasitica]KAF2758860.1 DUF1682-domain-containing protein [Pseudovirgaria hyperparasitica]